ncbi:MAG: 1-acyl-sn-glycerol-3-phosphate acyltransferase [Deltaproteobacteria bacterium]|nr:1-acyl-sn-glycerol-3-phosphate acyltransferase [Deltaproteobacteria bacterium]
MLRYVALNAFIGLFSVVMCIWALVIPIFGGSARTVHFRCAVPWAKVILRVCGIRVTVYGLENVRPEIPRIYMCNHQSFFDIWTILAFLPVDFKFILKQELMKIPLLGPAMTQAGYIGIERKDPRKSVKSIALAAKRIKGGASVLIFPEGTRSVDGHLQSFKRGGFNLAFKSGCDIVPMAINGSHRIATKGSLCINKGSYSFHIGEPISLSGYGKKDIPRLMDRVHDAISEHLP